MTDVLRSLVLLFYIFFYSFFFSLDPVSPEWDKLSGMVCNFAIEARGQNIISVNCIKTKEIMMMRDLNKNF